MAGPAAEGLFARAISQSGFGREASAGVGRGAGEAGRRVEPLAGRDHGRAELRALDAEQVMAVSTEHGPQRAGPVVDDVLPMPVSAAFAAGEEADVPYLVGTTDSEIPTRTSSSSDRGGRGGLDALFGQLAVRDAAAYGGEAERDLYLGSDVLFTEPARHLALAHGDDGPTYRYRFTIAPDAVVAADGGAPHTAELAFVFDDVRRQGTPVPNAEALADQVADLWVDFATDGEPDGWPRAGTGEA